MTLIIGIAGPAGSGKSTIAEHLRDHYGFEIVSLAEPIKRIVGDLFGFTEQQLYGSSKHREEPHPTALRGDGKPLTARYACQTLGTDWARACCPNVWVDLAVAKALASNAPGVAIPDVRFRNEMSAIRMHGGRLMRRSIPRSTWYARYRFWGRVQVPHSSESEQMAIPDNYFDAVVPQMSSKQAACELADEIVRGWM